MAKFNVVQKRRRTQIAEKKRKAHGDPSTGKLKVKSQPLSISGKRKRKLLKQWRRDQKDALQQGLITMEDVQMALSPTSSAKIHLKKKKKLKTSFKIKAKGKNKRKSDVPAADISTDAMVE
ncbi:PREDICTED: uncharacterized protein LOC109347250 isoform X2 [Lupinus angustifolius]|uniref:uncharacterized protein LOC109331218 isoform X2 n=1 Tax=Lupinus angustifolius TaxID=3871 RepID=UPI00092F3532|nr:PREDICTED: uncharacterized protein LOC109331218 isoform X2 [Lupinus angustifolius]XP_019442506.1 PREDICTED: uncharacterized protein LOC109347250 isoform X2 [Lupinus angustifolius]